MGRARVLRFPFVMMVDGPSPYINTGIGPGDLDLARSGTADCSTHDLPSPLDARDPMSRDLFHGPLPRTGAAKRPVPQIRLRWDTSVHTVAPAGPPGYLQLDITGCAL